MTTIGVAQAWGDLDGVDDERHDLEHTRTNKRQWGETAHTPQLQKHVCTWLLRPDLSIYVQHLPTEQNVVWCRVIWKGDNTEYDTEPTRSKKRVRQDVVDVYGEVFESEPCPSRFQRGPVHVATFQKCCHMKAKRPVCSPSSKHASSLYTCPLHMCACGQANRRMVITWNSGVFWTIEDMPWFWQVTQIFSLIFSCLSFFPSPSPTFFFVCVCMCVRN